MGKPMDNWYYNNKLELSDYPEFSNKPRHEQDTILRAIFRRRKKRGLPQLPETLKFSK